MLHKIIKLKTRGKANNTLDIFSFAELNKNWDF